MRRIFSPLISAAVSTCASTAHAYCFAEAAERYKVDERLLVAIAKTESSLNADATHINKNGTTDYGLMQINDSWLPKLSPYGITRTNLMHPCINVNVGAWILKANIAKHGYTWKAVGAYNANDDEKQRQYIHKVWRNFIQAASKPLDH